jgi:ABC-type Zn uptake system ZnuABC Zn-binding protein ZnuA
MRRRHFLATLGAATLAACKRSEPTASRTGPRAITSFLPLQSHAAAIAGDLIHVRQLLSRDAGPHDFQFSPEDVRKLAGAELFIVNGVGLESWMDELVKKAASPDLVVVDCSAGLELLRNPNDLDNSVTVEPGSNPHTWLDPVLAKQQAATILAALIKLDPPNRAAYARNAADYFAKLDALDAEFRAVLAPLPNKNLVTFHDAFPYLAARYKLNYVGAISEFPEKDPTPKQLAALVDKIRSLKVGVLFAENGYAPGLLKKIAAETGAKVSELDTLEVGQGTATAYLDRMGANLESLRKAFAKGD